VLLERDGGIATTAAAAAAAAAAVVVASGEGGVERVGGHGVGCARGYFDNLPLSSRPPCLSSLSLSAFPFLPFVSQFALSLLPFLPFQSSRRPLFLLLFLSLSLFSSRRARTHVRTYVHEKNERSHTDTCACTRSRSLSLARSLVHLFLLSRARHARALMISSPSLPRPFCPARSIPLSQERESKEPVVGRPRDGGR